MDKSLFLPLGDLLFMKYKDSKIRIKDYFQLKMGKTPPTKNTEYYENGTLPWLNSGALNDFENISQSNLITEKAKTECNLEFSQMNSVLISIIGLNIVWCRKKVLFNQSIVNLFSDNKMKNATLFFALRKTNLNNFANGCVFKALTKKTFGEITVNWVSDPEKQKIFYKILSVE